MIPHLKRDHSLWLFEPISVCRRTLEKIASLLQAFDPKPPTWITGLNFNGWLERAHPWTLF